MPTAPPQGTPGPPDGAPIPVPSSWRLLREARVLPDLVAALAAVPALARAPRGAGEPVLVFPGYGAGDASTAPLRAFLRALGYDARGWGLGRNGGDVAALVPVLLAATRRAAARSGRAVRLVGWSLGGALAREVAREDAASVERVVTLGTPVVGGPKYTTAGASYRRRGVDVDALERELAARDATLPIRVPVHALYSRRDGVVAWQACIDRVTSGVEHVEVPSTHTGLGFDARVYALLAERLALPTRGPRGPSPSPRPGTGR